jgi:hypothetical protein
VRLRLWLIIIAAVLLAMPRRSAGEQADAPPPEQAWTECIERFADALGSGAEEPQIAALLDKATKLHGFRAGEEVNLGQMLAAADKSLIVARHAYAQAPTTLAGDIAADFERSESIPAELKQAMVPPTAPAMQRADQVAADWVRTSLNLRASQSVGVIVLYSPEAEQTDAACQFILLKGERLGRDFHILEIAFGNPVKH